MELWEERLEICKECDSVKMFLEQFGGMVCGECGCVLNMKARIESATCPLNKWIINKDKE